MTNGSDYRLPGLDESSFQVPIPPNGDDGYTSNVGVTISGKRFIAQLYNVHTAPDKLDPGYFTVYGRLIDPDTGIATEPHALVKNKVALYRAVGSFTDRVLLDLGNGTLLAIVSVTTWGTIAELTGQSLADSANPFELVLLRTQSTKSVKCSVYRLSAGVVLGDVPCADPNYIQSYSNEMLSIINQWYCYRITGEALPWTKSRFPDESIQLVDVTGNYGYISSSKGDRVMDTAGAIKWQITAEKEASLSFKPTALVNGILFAKTSDQSLRIDIRSGEVTVTTEYEVSSTYGLIGDWILVGQKTLRKWR